MVQYGTLHYRTLLLVAMAASGADLPVASGAAEAKGSMALRPGRTVKVGESVDGRRIDLLIFGTGPEIVFVIASIHGNEAAGTPLVEQLAAHLQAHPALLDGRQVLIMPRANPDGVAAGRRTNANGVDLNRNFPAGNWAARDRHGVLPLSEPESRAICRVLKIYAPARIVSIHQPLACIDYDGPGRALAEAMAARMPLGIRRLGGRPGSLGSYAGEELDIPIITLELPRAADYLSGAELWSRYGPGLLAWLNPPAAAG